MEEPQKKLSQRHEGRPRKVRFKISSAYSGRVLKQVFEDGQELELPAKEHSRRVVRHCFEPGERWAGELPEGRRYPPAKLSAQRISIFKEGQTLGLGSTSPLLDCQPGDSRYKVSAAALLGAGREPTSLGAAAVDRSLTQIKLSYRPGFNGGLYILTPHTLYSACSANGRSCVLGSSQPASEQHLLGSSFSQGSFASVHFEE